MKYIAENYPEILNYSQERNFNNLQNINFFRRSAEFFRRQNRLS